MASSFEVGRDAMPRGGNPENFNARDSSPLVLARLIEGEIIPRLLLAHRAEVFAPAAARAAIAADEAEAFVPLVLALEVPALLAHVETVVARGITIESVYIDLLAPAARGLGEWWERDACDFIDVTMGLWRLQQIVHELASRMPVAASSRTTNRRAFFTVAPGNQHSFGLVLIEEFFRRAGWQTWSAAAPSEADLTAMVSRQWFELIGFTATCDEQLDHLPAVISAVRRASRNPAIGVMVGGPAFNARPDLAHIVGADATAADGRQAVAKAESLIERLAERAANAERATDAARGSG